MLENPKLATNSTSVLIIFRTSGVHLFSGPAANPSIRLLREFMSEHKSKSTLDLMCKTTLGGVTEENITKKKKNANGTYLFIKQTVPRARVDQWQN